MVTCLPIVHPLFASSRIRSGVRQVFQSALLPTLPFDTGYPIKVTAPGWTPVDYFIQAQVRVANPQPISITGCRSSAIYMMLR
jgi:hypothetical protein